MAESGRYMLILHDGDYLVCWVPDNHNSIGVSFSNSGDDLESAKWTQRQFGIADETGIDGSIEAARLLGNYDGPAVEEDEAEAEEETEE